MDDNERKRIDEIKAREKAATAGPWSALAEAPSDVWASDEEQYIGTLNRAADVAFSSNSRADVPWLLALVDRLTQDVATATSWRKLESAPKHGITIWLAARDKRHTPEDIEDNPQIGIYVIDAFWADGQWHNVWEEKLIEDIALAWKPATKPIEYDPETDELV